MPHSTDRDRKIERIGFGLGALIGIFVILLVASQTGEVMRQPQVATSSTEIQPLHGSSSPSLFQNSYLYDFLVAIVATILGIVVGGTLGRKVAIICCEREPSTTSLTISLLPATTHDRLFIPIPR